MQTSMPGILLLRVDYTVGEPDLYSLPFVVESGAAAERFAAEHPAAVLHRFDRGEGDRSLMMADGLADREFLDSLIDFVGVRHSFADRPELPSLLRSLGQDAGALGAWHAAELSDLLADERVDLTPSATHADQSNSGVIYGKQLILKLYRRLAPGTSPELEIGRFLTETVGFAHVAPLLGRDRISPFAGGARDAWRAASFRARRTNSLGFHFGMPGEVFRSARRAAGGAMAGGGSRGGKPRRAWRREPRPVAFRSGCGSDFGGKRAGRVARLGR